MERLDRSSQKSAPVALCVLSCNGHKTSQEFLKHLVDQTDDEDYDLIWIDNGSTDETEDLLTRHWDEHSNATILFNDENAGVIGGRNIGFEEFMSGCDSEYLMFLDNDQFVRRDWLRQHMAVIEHGYDLIGVEAWQMSKRFMPNQKNIRRQDWFAYVGCGGMMIRRQVVEAIGFFDEQFNPCYFEDPDYCFRAFNDGFKIGWNWKAKIIHMPHQTLGRVKDKTKFFTKSLMKFRSKWRGTQPPMIIQPDIPAFK